MTHSATKKRRRQKEIIYEFHLYVANHGIKSLAAAANLKKICEIYLASKCRIKIIDLLKKPQLAARDQIVAVPTVVRKYPKPIRTLIGDLSNTLRVLTHLDIPIYSPAGI